MTRPRRETHPERSARRRCRLPDLILNVHEPRRPRRIAAVEHDLHLAQVERFADAHPFAQAGIAPHGEADRRRTAHRSGYPDDAVYVPGDFVDRIVPQQDNR